MSGAVLHVCIDLDIHPCLCLMLEFKLSTVKWTLRLHKVRRHHFDVMLSSSLTPENCGWKAFGSPCFGTRTRLPLKANLWHSSVLLAWLGVLTSPHEDPQPPLKTVFAILLFIFKGNLANGHFYLLYTCCVFSNLLNLQCYAFKKPCDVTVAASQNNILVCQISREEME